VLLVSSLSLIAFYSGHQWWMRCDRAVQEGHVQGLSFGSDPSRILVYANRYGDSELLLSPPWPPLPRQPRREIRSSTLPLDLSLE
jgi:hypothetical protein